MNLKGVERISETCAKTAAENGGTSSRTPARGARSGQPLAPDELLIAARRNRPHARAQLIDSLMPLIASVARTYRYVPGVDRSELVQEGVVGLLRALERYDPQLRTPFWAYASWWVRKAMQQLVSELSGPVVLSDRALRQLARMRTAQRTFTRAHGREPSIRELAQASALPVPRLHELFAAERRPRTLEQAVERRRASVGTTVGELIADPRAEDAFDELATRLTATQVPRLLEQLSERERSVIRARYGLGGRVRSLRELSDAMGVSAERVRQIEQTALRAMRAVCSARRPRVPLAREWAAPGPRRDGPLRRGITSTSPRPLPAP